MKNVMSLNRKSAGDVPAPQPTTHHVFFETYEAWCQPRDVLSQRQQEPVWMLLTNLEQATDQPGITVLHTVLTISQVVSHYVHHLMFLIGRAVMPKELSVYQQHKIRGETIIAALTTQMVEDGFTVRRGALAYPTDHQRVITEITAAELRWMGLDSLIPGEDVK